MNTSFRKTLAISGALLASATGMLAAGGAAYADTAPGAATPAWEPDVNSQAPYGLLSFYDANGNQITGGTGLDQLFYYSMGNTTTYPVGASKATLYFAAPNHSQPTGSWFENQQSLSTADPYTAAPSVALAASKNPVAESTESGEADLNAFLGAANLDTTSGYANIIQMRVFTTTPRGASGSSPNYWDADIAYNNGTSPIVVDGVTVQPNSWTEIYGAFPAAAPPSSVPETPLVIGLPLAGLGLIGFGVVYSRRRRATRSISI